MKNPVPPEYKPFPKWGCPAPDPPIECVSKQTSCIHEEKNNVYRVVKTRTWWHCGKYKRLYDTQLKCGSILIADLS